MSVTKRIVCLANSKKFGGRCIAGRELLGNDIGGWIRPVSARPTEEISRRERQYSDGGEPEILDVIDVPLMEARPSGCQTENWLIYPRECWEKRGQLSSIDLDRLADPDESMWRSLSNTKYGRNDKIEANMIASMANSLRLIHVDDLTLSVFLSWPDTDYEKLRVQARFQHCSTEYRLWVTDSIYEDRYLKMSHEDYDFGECFITVSIGEPMRDGTCYLLVAAIMECDAGYRTT